MKRQHMMVQSHQATKERYDNNGKDWYFRFGDDNKMSDKYILSIT